MNKKQRFKLNPKIGRHLRMVKIIQNSIEKLTQLTKKLQQLEDIHLKKAQDMLDDIGVHVHWE